MLRLFTCRILVLFSCSFILFGCGLKDDGPADTEQTPLSQISCIGVLPAMATVEGQAAPVYLPKDKGLQRGVQIMNEILSEELGGQRKIRFVNLEQIAGLELTGGESALVLASMVGKSINCNAVLESTVKRYAERIGGRYSVESPASVAFEMRLISLDTNFILWSVKFDEVQKSVMENLLEWKKANTRKFTWITAEELMQEGVKGKLVESPFFNSAGNMEKDSSSTNDS